MCIRDRGKSPFTLDSKAPAGGYQEFLMNEARYSALTRAFPERAEKLFQENEALAKARYEHLVKLQEQMCIRDRAGTLNFLKAVAPVSMALWFISTTS